MATVPTHGRSRPGVRRRVVALVAAGWVIAAGCAIAAASAATAQEPGACVGVEGVTVVVDATALGGDLDVRCALGPQRSGLAALAAAGFSVEGVTASPGFVCRIDGRPGLDTETCAAIPPPTTYWSYWVAAAAGEWEYATSGAATREPAPGSVEGWAFTAGSDQAAPPAASPVELGAVPSGIPVPDAEPAFPWGMVAGVAVAAAVVAGGILLARRRDAGAVGDGP
ncbi:hypothetical protein BH24ACT7_BH24ACT7_20760 [soil metagenome]